MKLPNIPTTWLIAGGAVAAAMLYVSAKGAKQTGQSIGTAGVDLADGIIAGTVTGIGGKVGIPATNMTACERAKAEGRTWDASFDCPAADFIKYLWN